MTTPNPKKKLSFYLRFAISLVLLAYVFYKAGLMQIWATIRQADLLFLILSVAITPLLVWASSWKWQVILRAMNIRVSAAKCFWLYVVGYFFNTVLPTNVGGDVVRAYAVGKSTGKRAEAFSSVFVERFTGLSVLLLTAIIAFFLAIRQLWNLWLNIALILSVVGYTAILAVVLSPGLLNGLKRIIPLKPVQQLLEKLLKFQTATLSLRTHPGAFVFAMINSVFFYFLAIINVYISALAFRADLSFAGAVIITPIIMVITMLPISIGGIGLAEGAYFFTFERFGIIGAVGLSVALLMRAKALLAGAVGGIYYSTMGMQIKSEFLGKEMQYDLNGNDVKGEVTYFSGFEDVMRQRKSPIKKYQDIQIGNYRLFSLIKFESIIFLFGYLPGMAGYFFRQFFFPALFKRVGKGTVFGRSLSLQHSGKITIGKKCVIDEYCKLSAQGGGDSEIILGDEVLLGRGTVLGTREGRIEIGDFSNIGANCRMGTTSQIKLGKYVLLAANCYIGGAQHRFDRLDVPIMRQGYQSRGGVVIEDNVWLGAGVTVLDGVRIGSGSVIGAGSVVTKDIPPNSIAIGVPAKIKGSRIELKADDAAA
jgi:uncharacterized protein (TIRG00374 family)